MLFPRRPGRPGADPDARTGLRSATTPTDDPLRHRRRALQRRSGGQCAGNPPCPHAPRTLQRKQRIERPDLRRRWAAAALFRRGLPTWGSGARGGPKGSSASPTPGPLEVLRFPKGAAAAGFRTRARVPPRQRRTLRSPADPAGSSDTRRPRNASANPSSSRQRSVVPGRRPQQAYGSGANAFSRDLPCALQSALAEQGRQPLRAGSPRQRRRRLGNCNQVPAAALAQVGLRPGDRILRSPARAWTAAQNPQQIDAVLWAAHASKFNAASEPFRNRPIPGEPPMSSPLLMLRRLSPKAQGACLPRRCFDLTRPRGKRQLNRKDAELAPLFLIARITGKNFVIDPRWGYRSCRPRRSTKRRL